MLCGAIGVTEGEIRIAGRICSRTLKWAQFHRLSGASGFRFEELTVMENLRFFVKCAACIRAVAFTQSGDLEFGGLARSPGGAPGIYPAG